MPVVDSTNTALKEQHRKQALAVPTLLFTDHQRAGRGTRGRTWVQPPGKDLAMSFAVPLDASAVLDMRLSLSVGGGLAVVIEEATGVPLRVKWPNDVLAPTAPANQATEWRKAGGILIETCEGGSQAEKVLIAGVGINVNSSAAEFPAELAGKLTTLRDANAAPVSRTAVHLAVGEALATLLAGSASEQSALATPKQIERSLDQWFSRDLTAGTRYILSRGEQQLPVTASAVDRGTCALQCTDEQGVMHTVTSYTELSPADGP